MAENLIKSFIDAIKPDDTKNKSDNTYAAKVSRIDKDGTVWVYVAGSDKETPTALSSSEVKKGDAVNVEWRNNKLYIAGNTSNPSVGVEKVVAVDNKASVAMYDAARAQSAAESAVASAETAAEAAVSASTSAASAGRSASNAQAASEAAQAAALGAVTTDTIHYLATSQGSGVTRNTQGWTTSPQTMTSTEKYLWTYHTYTTAGGASTYTDPVITGVYGEKGADGSSVTILGSYNTLAELEAAHPTGNPGDAYMVGGDLYIWNGSSWQDVGQIQGPQGDTGPSGANGISVSSVQPQYYLSISPTSLSGGSWSTALTYVVGKYIWTRDYITYSDNTHNTSTAIYNQALTQSCKDAANALGLIEAHQEYFWHDSLGAHVLGETSGYRNDLTSTGMKIIDTSRTPEVSVAEFGASSATIGPSASGHTTIKPTGMKVYGGSGTELADIGYDKGIDAHGGLSDGVYTTIGGRTSGSTIGNFSTAFGSELTASGFCAQAEGRATQATGPHSHAEGYGAKAIGSNSHAEGFYTEARKENSHASGKGTIADGLNQTVIGQYNATDTSSLFIIGKGSSNGARSNAMTVSSTGNATFAGSVTSAGHQLISRNFICYANSRVDTFTNGYCWVSLSSFGISTGQKPVGILLTHQDGGNNLGVAGKRTVILSYDYDQSDNSDVLIRAYNEDGSEVNGLVRYFAAVFQNSWTSA